jgi:hypothetical protein
LPTPKRGICDSFKNLHVAGTATKIARQSLANISAGRLWVFAQQVNAGKYHSWSADAALCASEIEKSLLQRV